MVVRAYLEGGGPSRAQWAILACVLLGASGLGNAALAVGALATAAVVFGARVRVRVTGAGFRPLSAIEFVDLVASDELDAFDQKKANTEQRRHDTSMQRSRY